MPFYAGSCRFTMDHTVLRGIMSFYAGSCRFTRDHAVLRWIMPFYAGSCRFTRDHAVLREIMPFYAGSCRFTLDHVVLRWIMPFYAGSCRFTLDHVFLREIIAYLIAPVVAHRGCLDQFDFSFRNSSPWVDFSSTTRPSSLAELRKDFTLEGFASFVLLAAEWYNVRELSCKRRYYLFIYQVLVTFLVE